MPGQLRVKFVFLHGIERKASEPSPHEFLPIWHISLANESSRSATPTAVQTTVA